MSTRTIGPTDATARPYVPALAVHGDLVFVSGQTPIQDTPVVTDSIETQVRTVLSRIETILGYAGASLEDVVHCGVYLADLHDLPRVNAVYKSAFGGRLPTRTTIGVELPGYGIEIDCVAVLPTRAGQGDRPS